MTRSYEEYGAAAAVLAKVRGKITEDILSPVDAEPTEVSLEEKIIERMNGKNPRLFKLPKERKIPVRVD